MDVIWPDNGALPSFHMGSRPLNESADSDAFQELLPALARGLDVRDFFRHLTGVASRVVPHDEARLVLLSDDRSRPHTYASTRDGAAEEVLDGTTWAIVDANEPRLLDVVPGPERDMRSALTVPLRIENRSVGFFALFSRRAHAYSPGHLGEAERLAAHLAVALSHERLAERARDAAVEQERLATLECSVELLRAIADVLDIRSIFPQVSDIAKKMLPHDGLLLSFVDRNGEVVQAARSADVPEMKAHAVVRMPFPADEIIIDDITIPSEQHRLATLLVKDTCALDDAVQAGYRALLCVHARAREQAILLAFWSRRAKAFDRRDVPVARRIADHVALAVSHEQLAEAERQVAEARARAQHLEARVKRLSEELDVKTHVRVVGESAEWLDVLKKATQVGATETTVLVSGESGTGKEVVARFIHRGSARRTGPFVALNCAALPEQLLESELFGYERGAFTGAQLAKPGQIELASGGVLFLDEVSEMSPSAQAKFLRVLQEREFQRLGGTRPLRANIRVVAATNRDLTKAVERGDFREDLYYRLQVFEVHIPPLRERRADVVPLSEAFLQEIGKSFGRPPAGLTRDAREALLRHDWPGNVRELRNALERAAILCEGGLIDAHHLALRPASKPSGPAISDLNTLERETIERVLRECRGNKSKAARRLGLSRTQLYVRIRKYGHEASVGV